MSDWVLLQCWPVCYFDIDILLYVPMAILALMAAEERVSISKLIFHIVVSSTVIDFRYVWGKLAWLSELVARVCMSFIFHFNYPTCLF